MTEYQQRKQRILGPCAPCECGERATVMAGNIAMCQRCRDSQTQARGFQRRQAACGVPEPHQQSRAVEEFHFTPNIIETVREIVVRAHGEYRLRLGGAM